MCASDHKASIDRETLLRRVVLKCRDFVRQLSYHRAMHPRIENARTNFLIYTFNNFIAMAVLDWCHLFGSHSDDLHWRNVVIDEVAFNRALLDAFDIYQDAWENNWRLVKGYRDKDVAHLEVRPSTTVPEMELSLQSVCFYHDSIIEELREWERYRALPERLADYVTEVGQLADRYVADNIVNLLRHDEND